MATGPPSISPRAASITDVIGFPFTNACSHPGIVSGWTNAELANVSGRMIMKPHVLTDSGVRAVMPMNAIGQHIVMPNATTSSERAEGAGRCRRRTGTPATSPKPVMIRMLHAIRTASASDPPADHRRPGDRERAEPVDHPALEVDVQGQRGGERQERHASAPGSPGSANCRYSLLDPAIAPPNTNTNSTRNMSGWIVISTSCSGWP